VALIVPKPEVARLPAGGLRVQVTAVFVLSVTIAVNCCDWPLYSTALDGVTLRETFGTRVTDIVATAVGFAAHVAVMVTICCVVMLAGAV